MLVFNTRWRGEFCKPLSSSFSNKESWGGCEEGGGGKIFSRRSREKWRWFFSWRRQEKWRLFGGSVWSISLRRVWIPGHWRTSLYEPRLWRWIWGWSLLSAIIKIQSHWLLWEPPESEQELEHHILTEYCAKIIVRCGPNVRMLSPIFNLVTGNAK